MKQKFFLKSLFILFLFKGLITMGQAVLKTQDFETGTSNWGYTSTPSSYEDLTTSTNPSVWGLVEKLENQLFSSRKIIPTTLPVDNISFWGISNYDVTHRSHTLVLDDVDLTTHQGYKLLTFDYNTEFTRRFSVTVPVRFEGFSQGARLLSSTKKGWNKYEYYIPNTVSNFGVSVNCETGGFNKSSYMAGFDNFKIEQTNFIDVENRSAKKEINISYDVTFPINFTGYLDSPDATLKITANIAHSSNTAEVEDFTIKTPSLNFTSSSEEKDLIITINPDEDFEDEKIILDLELTSKDGTVRNFRETIRIEDTDHPLVLNEVYTNPDIANGDANGDGVIDSLNDQFIELYNPNNYAVDISGFELEVGKILTGETNYTFSKYHIFPSGTVIPANEIIVVFGGGTPTNISGIVQIANENKLDLNDTGTTKGFLSIKGSFYESSRRVFANDLVYDRLSGVSTAVYRKYDAVGNIHSKDFVDHTTIVSNPVLFSPGKNNQENPLAYRWTGSTSNDWHTASNWLNNTVPPANVDVEIASELSNYPTVNTPITVKSLLLGDNTSLIANASITGPVTYSKGFLTRNWYLAASPVFNQGVRSLVDLVPFAFSSFSGPRGLDRGLASYTSSSNSWWYFSEIKGFNAYLESGQGFAFKFSRANVLVPFKGTINSVNVTKLVNVFGDSSFNLLGNPFTAYVNSKTLLTENTGLLSEETVWLWNGTQYVTYNKINPIEIAPAQGFFVKAATRGDFIFKTTNQSHQSTSTFMRQVPKSNFELFVTEGSNKKSTKVFFIDNKTTGFDNGYDSSMFNDTASNFEIFTGLVSNDVRKKLAIQTLPKLNYNEIIIPVGLIAEADKEVEFSVNTQNLPEDLEVYLEDRLNHQFINLSKENYAITLKNKAEGVGQFYIHTTHKKLSNEDILKNRNSISIFKSGKREITISGLKDKANIGVYSILGEELMNTQVTSKGANKIGLLSFSAGIYIVKLHSELGVISKKIILE